MNAASRIIPRTKSSVPCHPFRAHFVCLTVCFRGCPAVFFLGCGIGRPVMMALWQWRPAAEDEGGGVIADHRGCFSLGAEFRYAPSLGCMGCSQGWRENTSDNLFEIFVPGIPGMTRQRPSTPFSKKKKKSLPASLFGCALKNPMWTKLILTSPLWYL